MRKWVRDCEVFKMVKMEFYGGHGTRRRRVKVMEICDSFFRMTEFSSRLPFTFLTRKTLPLNKILEVTPSEMRVHDLLYLLFLYSCNKVWRWGGGSNL